jgi:acyl-CoA synthetase (AMP-forming)/AMP-acid ligase II
VAHVLRGGRIYRDVFGLTPDDTVLAAVPLAHSFGLVGGLAACLVTGATLVTLPRFTPRGLVEGLAGGATVLLGTPTVYDLAARILPARRPDAGIAGRSRLRMALCSGAPLARAVADGAAARLGVGVHDVYGSTETGLIACRPPGDEPQAAGSVGRPAPGVAVRVAGGGRLWVRTATALTGYADGGPPPPVDSDGFYDTGDLAALVDGDIRLHGRKPTFVNVGGRKVNPRRVEDVVRTLAGVCDVAVYGVEAEGGEEVCAAVVLDGWTTVAGLLAGCRSRLAAYEVPHRVHLVDRLPRDAMGKVERAHLPR